MFHWTKNTSATDDAKMSEWPCLFLRWYISNCINDVAGLTAETKTIIKLMLVYFEDNFKKVRQCKHNYMKSLTHLP